jgi:hypothetical protein
MVRKIIQLLCFIVTLLFVSPYAYAQYTETVVSGTAFENPTTNWAAGDDATIQVNLGFTFPFGSVSSPNNTSQIYINSNGGLSLSSWSSYQNTGLPTNPSTIIAPYWDDLNRGAGGTIRYGTFGAAGNKRFIVSWNSVPRYGINNSSCSFQVVLYESGDIRFRYSTANTNCNGASATIGIQENNSEVKQHSLNQAINLSQDIIYTPTANPPPPPPPAIPLEIGQCDDFERDMSNWTVTGNGSVDISTLTSNSPTHSLNVYANTVSATSIPINTSSNFKELTVWIRRGSDSFSENPDNGEDLFIEYLNSSNSWVTLEQFSGAGTQGQIFNRTYTMPAAAKHNNFRIRLRLQQGSGANYDYWHVDDVCLVAQNPLPVISLQKTSVVLSDGINTINPKRIPGALVEYNIIASNTGSGAADNNSIILTDAIPANTALYINDISGAGTGPVRFVDGSPPSGLNYQFVSLASTTDNLSFSNNNGVSYSYIPTPDAAGLDSQITNIRINMTGQFLANSGSGNPSFSLKFRVKVK